MLQSQSRRETVKRAKRSSLEKELEEKKSELADAVDEEEQEWLEGEIDNITTELGRGQLMPIDQTVNVKCCSKVQLTALFSLANVLPVDVLCYHVCCATYDQSMALPLFCRRQQRDEEPRAAGHCLGSPGNELFLQSRGQSLDQLLRRSARRCS